MNLAPSSSPTLANMPVDLLGAPWVAQSGPDLANIYLHARYYDPTLGVFLSPDPAGADLNSYRYAGGDPVNRLDPSGLMESMAWGTATCYRGLKLDVSQEDGPVYGDQWLCISNGDFQLFGSLGGTPACYEFCDWDPNTNAGGGTIPTMRDVIPPIVVDPPVVTPPGRSDNVEEMREQQRDAVDREFRRVVSDLLPSTRTTNCALGYYGIDPLSVGGLGTGGKWAAIASAAGGIPKSVPEAFGLRVIRLPGSSNFTSALSIASLAGGGGSLRAVANFGSKWAGPIGVASALIDASAIGVCTAWD